MHATILELKTTSISILEREEIKRKERKREREREAVARHPLMSFLSLHTSVKRPAGIGHKTFNETRISSSRTQHSTFLIHWKGEQSICMIQLVTDNVWIKELFINNKNSTWRRNYWRGKDLQIVKFLVQIIWFSKLSIGFILLRSEF